MLRHYVTNILPNGYKAQVVAYSRLAAVRYLEAFRAARDELLAEAERCLSPEDKAWTTRRCARGRPGAGPGAGLALPRHAGTDRVRAHHLGQQQRRPGLEAVDRRRGTGAAIKRFKKPLFHANPAKTDPLAFLVVKSMLLTGFDAPIEGVMYLDRPIREAELLQAIARVNRTGFGKRCGIVVDYYGVAQHLKEALASTPTRTWKARCRA
jgi:type I restriction enzyme, R subunit